MADSFNYVARPSLSPFDPTQGVISLVDPTATAFGTDHPPATLELNDFAEHRFIGRYLDTTVLDGEIHNFSGQIELLERISVLPPRSDFNQNGTVDAADYVIWRNSRGQSGEGLPADVAGEIFQTSDGIVDDHDYDFWRGQFGMTTPTSAANDSAIANIPVPEADASILALVGSSLISFTLGNRYISRSLHRWTPVMKLTGR